MVKVTFLKSPEITTELKRSIISSDFIDIAIAFVTSAGLRSIIKEIDASLQNGKKHRFIVGLSSFNITEPDALLELYNLSEHPNFDVGCYNTERFHPKLFYFKKTGEAASIIGSSNLTRTGISTNIEANILINGLQSESVFKNIENYFETLWENIDPLSEEIIDAYQKNYSKMRYKEKKVNEIPRTPVPPIAVLSSSTNTIGDLLKENSKEHCFIMHLSYQGKERRRLWEYALKNEIIGLQHGIVYDDWAIIRDDVRQKMDSQWIYQFDLFCRKGRQVKRGLDIGDIVVVLEGQDHLLGVCEIVDSYEFISELAEIFFDHVMSVSWKYFKEYDQRMKIPRFELFTSTLRRIDKKDVFWKQVAEIRIK